MQGTLLYRVLIGVGLAISLLGAVWLRGAVAAARTEAAHPATALLLVHRVTLAAGTVLMPTEFVSRVLPLSDVPPGSVTTASGLSGAVARQTLWAGEAVVAGMLYPNLTAAQLDERLPFGMRAVDLPVTAASGVGGLLADGDRVDVLAVLNAGATPEASTVLTDVPVLGLVGGSAGSTSVAGVSSGGSYSSVVLELTPAQATALVLAEGEGTITLTLRNPDDAAQPAPTVSLSQLKGGVR